MIVKVIKWLLRHELRSIKSVLRYISITLLVIKRGQAEMTASIQQLDQQLSAQLELIQLIASDVNALLAKLPIPVDMQAEVDKVQATFASLQSTHEAIQAALNTPPETPPTETPTETPPTE